MRIFRGFRGALTAALLVAVALVAAPSAAGDCNKDCSDTGACTESTSETGAGTCVRTVTIEVNEAGEITKTIVCETEAGPCGDFGPLEY
jgi:hypothetical protein